MALEHALLVSLSERPASGLELAKRFDRSIGFFWSASHQQIYRTLARMEADGQISSEEVVGEGRPARKVYSVTSIGEKVLAEWLAEPPGIEPTRSELAVKMRGASYGDRAAVLDGVRTNLADHQTRLAHYRAMAERDYPRPDELTGQDLDLYLVLLGGIRSEEFFISWLTECLTAYERTAS